MKLVINVVLALMVVGMALWLINSYVPMAGSIRAILNIVVVVATCVGVLQALGLWAGTVRLWHHLTTRAAIESSYHEPPSSERIIHPPTGAR
jgi:undecaprenyl pyrophosphate phosphatase UppP